MISGLTEDQAKLTARILEIEAELEKVDKKHLKAMIRANDLRDQIDNLLYELTPLKNGFWQSKKII